jgi:hypothetical protein
VEQTGETVVFLFNLVRRSSFCVVSRDCVILGRLSCGCGDRGRVVVWHFGVVFDRYGGVIRSSVGVVGWGSIRSRVVLRCLGGVVTRGRVTLSGVGVESRGSVSCGITLQRLTGVVTVFAYVVAA